MGVAVARECGTVDKHRILEASKAISGALGRHNLEGYVVRVSVAGNEYFKVVGIGTVRDDKLNKEGWVLGKQTANG
jgi:hypothetical protein